MDRAALRITYLGFRMDGLQRILEIQGPGQITSRRYLSQDAVGLESVVDGFGCQLKVNDE